MARPVYFAGHFDSTINALSQLYPQISVGNEGNIVPRNKFGGFDLHKLLTWVSLLPATGPRLAVLDIESVADWCCHAPDNHGVIRPAVIADFALLIRVCKKQRPDYRFGLGGVAMPLGGAWAYSTPGYLPLTQAYNRAVAAIRPDFVSPLIYPGLDGVSGDAFLAYEDAYLDACETFGLPIFPFTWGVQVGVICSYGDARWYNDFAWTPQRIDNSRLDPALGRKILDKLKRPSITGIIDYDEGRHPLDPAWAALLNDYARGE